MIFLLVCFKPRKYIDVYKKMLLTSSSYSLKVICLLTVASVVPLLVLTTGYCELLNLAYENEEDIGHIIYEFLDKLNQHSNELNLYLNNVYLLTDHLQRLEGSNYSLGELYNIYNSLYFCLPAMDQLLNLMSLNFDIINTYDIYDANLLQKIHDLRSSFDAQVESFKQIEEFFRELEYTLMHNRILRCMAPDFFCV